MSFYLGSFGFSSLITGNVFALGVFCVLRCNVPADGSLSDLPQIKTCGGRFGVLPILFISLCASECWFLTEFGMIFLFVNILFSSAGSSSCSSSRRALEETGSGTDTDLHPLPPLSYAENPGGFTLGIFFVTEIVLMLLGASAATGRALYFVGAAIRLAPQARMMYVKIGEERLALSAALGRLVTGVRIPDCLAGGVIG